MGFFGAWQSRFSNLGLVGQLKDDSHSGARVDGLSFTAQAALLLALSQMMIFWIDLRRVATRVMPDRPWRARSILVLLPLLTVGITWILVIGVLLALFYIAIIVDSLR